MDEYFPSKRWTFFVLLVETTIFIVIYNYIDIGMKFANITRYPLSDNHNSSTRKFGVSSKSELSIYNEPETLLDLPTIFNTANIQSNISTVKYIILWYHPPTCIERYQRSVNKERCEYNNCVYTHDRRYLHNSSAIVFVPSRPDMPINQPLSTQERNPNQIWIAYSLEPPVYKLQWTNVINWTMTYRFDSDVLAPYGALKSRKNPSIRNYTTIFQKKTKMAAWIVSHCNAVSKRDNYVAELKKAGVEVDIFGNCGTNIHHLNESQVKDLLNNYKFFISFENTLCKDYIAEKLFNKYNLDLILIVRGAADYDKLLPTKTFINTAHFLNISSIASHVLQLANDKTQYTQFLKRKNKYEAMSAADFGYPYSICNLCRKLNINGNKRKNYRTIMDFLQDKACHLAEDIPNFVPSQQINSNIYTKPKSRVIPK